MPTFGVLTQQVHLEHRLITVLLLTLVVHNLLKTPRISRGVLLCPDRCSYGPIWYYFTTLTLSIIIPVYNEADAVDSLLSRVVSAPLPHGWEKQIVIINDGSTDGTGQAIDRYIGHAEVVHRQANGGKGAAVKDGLRLAKGEYVLIQDADLEYDPYDYGKLLAPIIDNGHEVVFGSRVLGQNNVSYSRIFFHGGVMLTKVFNVFFKTSLTDLATCYKVFPKRFCEDLVTLPSNDFTFDVVELSHHLAQHTPIIEVPISYQARSKGAGKKLSFKHGIRCFNKILSLYAKA
jgi:glycosyltransferase involved in cell wall biosynthesis